MSDDYERIPMKYVLAEYAPYLVGLAIAGSILCVGIFVLVPEMVEERAELEANAKTWCVKPEFYSDNFELCERLEVRPE